MRAYSTFKLKRLLLVSCLILLFAFQPGAAVSDFEKTVKGRCTDWGYMNGVTGIDCDKIWTDFVAVLTDSRVQLLCTMDPSLYQSVVESMFKFVTTITNPTLYSRSADLVRPLCKGLRVCTSLEVTLPGYIFDELDWCDTKFTGGVSYQTQCGCTGKAEMVYAFWKSASSAYSQRVSGTVQVILNGSIMIPFQENATFTKIELPNLKSPRVQEAVIYLVKQLNDSNTENICESENLVALKSTLAAQGVKSRCVEDPPFITHLLCIRDPTNRRCTLNSAKTQMISHWLIIPILFAVQWTF